MSLEVLLAQIDALGLTLVRRPDGGLRVLGKPEKIRPLSPDIAALRDELLSVAEARETLVFALIAEAREAGLVLTAEGDMLRVRQRTNAGPDERLIRRLADNKPAVLAALRKGGDLLDYAKARLGIADDTPLRHKRDEVPPSPSSRGVMCSGCRRLDRCYTDPQGRFLCPQCVEWRVEGCPAFTVLETAQEAREGQYGACLSCGASIELHGSPSIEQWRRVRSVDDVRLVAPRYIIALATALARGGAR